MAMIQASIVSSSSCADQTGRGSCPQKGRILVVDDVADNRALLTRQFQRRGYEIVEAVDGAEALRLVADQVFDLVLLDVMMPGIDGLQVLASLRQTHSSAALPVIMVTARSEASDIARALNAGANDYVTKPIDFPIVLARSLGQIERRRAELALRDTNEALRRSNARLLEANERLRHQIARERAYEERIAYLAHHDALTGLANRKLFEERLRTALDQTRAGKTGVAVLFIECAGLRSVREALGHAVADALVKTIATQLRNGIGADDLLARMSTNEYAIVHTSPDEPVTAASLAARLIQLVGECRSFDGHAFGLKTHIGISLDDGCGGVALLQQADLAMRRAAAAGSDTYRFFNREMDAEVRNRRTLEIDLRKAVAERSFEIHYQPIHDIRRDRVTSCEALLRWTHPERGPVSPAEFVPLAEATGLIGALGEWVLRTACREACRWPREVAVAVNISVVQFRDPTLVETVRKALEDSGLPPHRLQLEITESVMLADSDANLDTLRIERSRRRRQSRCEFQGWLRLTGRCFGLPFMRGLHEWTQFTIAWLVEIAKADRRGSAHAS